MDNSQNDLHKEAAPATAMLQGKTVARVMRNRPGEVVIEIQD